MVDFFLVLNTNIGSWIQNLERRDIVLLSSLAEKYLDLQGRMPEKIKPAWPRSSRYGNAGWNSIRHADDCNVRIKTQIQGDLVENPTGQALADLIHKEPKILAKEVRWLRDKAWKARRRAGERKEHRNQTQNTLLKRIFLLKAALTETTPL